jgi:hypothetical protein
MPVSGPASTTPDDDDEDDETLACDVVDIPPLPPEPPPVPVAALCLTVPPQAEARNATEERPPIKRKDEKRITSSLG